MKIISQHRGGKSRGTSTSRVKHPRAASAVAGKSKSVAKAAVKARQGNGNGNGNGHGNGHSAGRAKLGAAPVVQPHYDEGLRYGSDLHYADVTPPTPPPGGAKVRLELASRSDADLAAFGEAHVSAMAGNPNFPTPTPSTSVFAQWLADYEAILSQLEILRVQMKNLTVQKDVLRAGFQAIFAQRGDYVQVASNGNADIIATSGLPVRRGPTPVGQLMWPENLVLELTQISGEFRVRWKPVTSAKGYLLQCAEVVAGQPRVWVSVYTGGKFSSVQKNLTPGKTYEFQVATLGGSTGQSDFSPVVQRMAA